MRSRYHHSLCTARAAPTAFAGFRFPPEIIIVIVAVRWYLPFGLSYRDVEELLAERGVEVDHVTIYRWVRASRHCWPRLLGRAAMAPAIAGPWTRPM